jgi:hypothetical protein
MAKGGSFENEVCRELSLWFTNGERDDAFCRSDGSGSRFTKRIKKGKDTANQGGDISFCYPDGEQLIKIWCVECKTGYASKSKIKDANGDVIQTPIFKPAKKGEKKKANENREIIGWKNKVSIVPWDILDFIDSRQKNTVLQKMWSQCKRDADLTSRVPILIFRRNNRQACLCFMKHYFYQLSGYFGKPLTTIIHLDIGDYSPTGNLVIMALKDFFSWTINFRQSCL